MPKSHEFHAYNEIPKKKSKFKRNALIGIVFIFIVGLLLYGGGGTLNLNLPGGITGGAVSTSGEDIDESKSVGMKATLGLVDFNLKGHFYEIKLSGNNAKEFFVEDQKFSLDLSKSSYINLKNFDGKISIQGKKVFLDGESEEVFVNGVGVSDKRSGFVDVSSGEDFSFSSLELIQGALIKDLAYKTNGNVQINDNYFKLNDDEISLNNFYGNVKIQDKMILDGRIKSLDISGTQGISIKA